VIIALYTCKSTFTIQYHTNTRYEHFINKYQLSLIDPRDVIAL